MRDLAGPALVSGFVPAGSSGPVTFREIKTGALTTVLPDPATWRFQVALAEGEYETSHNGVRTSLSVLPGGTYTLDLRPGGQIDLKLASKTGPDGTVTIQVTAEGSGRHTLSLRADNLRVSQPERQVDLKAGSPQTITFQGKVAALDSPWVAVVLPDDNIGLKKEVTGTAAAVSR
jgi:hypothetical protein